MTALNWERSRQREAQCRNIRSHGGLQFSSDPLAGATVPKAISSRKDLEQEARRRSFFQVSQYADALVRRPIRSNASGRADLAYGLKRSLSFAAQWGPRFSPEECEVLTRAARLLGQFGGCTSVQFSQ